MLQIVFKSQRKLADVFRFKDRLPFDLEPAMVYKYSSSYYGETDRKFKVRSGETIVTFRKAKAAKESVI